MRQEEQHGTRRNVINCKSVLTVTEINRIFAKYFGFISQIIATIL